MSRDPETIQHEIERARAALAETFDLIAERTSPKRVVDQGRQALLERARSPQGRRVIAAAGAVTLLLTVRRVRKARRNRRAHAPE